MARKLAWFPGSDLLEDMRQLASMLSAYVFPLAEEPQTLVDGDTTPAVGSGEYFECANTGATSITTFDDGYPGKMITVKLDANTTLVNGATLKLAGAVNLVGSADDLVTLRMGSDNVWRQQSPVSVN